MKRLREILFAVTFLACVLSLWSIGDAQSPPQRNGADTNLAAIKVTQMRPRWEVKSLGQSGATPGNTECHIAIAAAPADLVVRQRVFLNSTDGGSTESELGPNGGIVKLTNVAATAELKAVITVEFRPELGLPTAVKEKSFQSSTSGTIGLFQVLSDETTCFVDPTGWTRCGDYLTCQISSKHGDAQKSRIRHLLTTTGATSQLQTAEFVIVRDDDDPIEPTIRIAGRLGCLSSVVLGDFTVSELEVAGAVLPAWSGEKCQFVFRPSRPTLAAK